MRLKILPSALGDLADGRSFYAKQGENLGAYFLDSLFSDIDSLELFGGIHRKVLGYLRLVWVQLSVLSTGTGVTHPGLSLATDNIGGQVTARYAWGEFQSFRFTPSSKISG